MTYTSTCELHADVIKRMNQILNLKTGLKDTKEGHLIQKFDFSFLDQKSAEVKICNGDKESPPWIDCVLFSEEGNEISCFVSEKYNIENEFVLWDGRCNYRCVIAEGI